MGVRFPLPAPHKSNVYADLRAICFLSFGRRTSGHNERTGRIDRGWGQIPPPAPPRGMTIGSLGVSLSQSRKAQTATATNRWENVTPITAGSRSIAPTRSKNSPACSPFIRIPSGMDQGWTAHHRRKTADDDSGRCGQSLPSGASGKKQTYMQTGRNLLPPMSRPEIPCGQYD